MIEKKLKDIEYNAFRSLTNWCVVIYSRHQGLCTTFADVDMPFKVVFEI